METLAKADIFFFVTTIAVIILTILISICFYYLSGALRNLRDITATLKEGVDKAEERVEEFIERIEENAMFRFIFGSRKTTRKKKTKSTE
jgi:uncharacterized membrane protein (DUF106 family)